MSDPEILDAEGEIDGRAGRLHIRTWRPSGRLRGVLAICHGFNAHSAYYDWAAARFAMNGFAVYAVDLRGRGKSGGERYFASSIDDYVADLHALVEHAKARELGLSVFLLGHSAGGVISVSYVLDHPDTIAGLICASFAYRVPAPDFALAVIKGLAHVAPHAHPWREAIAADDVCPRPC